MKKCTQSKLLYIFLFALLLLTSAQYAQGATCTWTPATNGSFNDYMHWAGCGAMPPGAGDDVVITAGGSYTITMPSSATVNSMTIGAVGGGKVTLSGASNTLTINTLSSVPSGGDVSIYNTTINGPGALKVDGIMFLSGATINAPLDNYGTIQVDAASGSFNSDVTGSFITRPGSNLNIVGDFGPAGLNVVSSPFTNNGNIGISTNGINLPTLSVNSGAGTLKNMSIISTAGSGLATGNLYAQLDNQGTVTVASGGPLLIGLGSHTNSGTININDGTTLSQGSFTNTGSINIGAGKTLTVLTIGTFANAGSIGGAGTLDVSGAPFSNSGILKPGATLGKLSILGPLPQTSTSVVNIELGGTSAGVNYDQVAVSGVSTLAGTLNVTLSFTPALYDVFTILTYGSKTGSFGSTNLPALAGGKGWSIDYGVSATSLKVVDIGAPTVSAFVVPPVSSSLAVPVTSFSAIDNVAVTDYCLTEVFTANVCIWTANAPTSYIAASEGILVLYAWAKDAAGNVSTPMTASVSIALPDATAPVITAFTAPTTSSSLSIPITIFTATDAVGVTGYMVNESATPPDPKDTNWSGTAPAGYSATTAGIKSLYAWAKDAAGNVSVPISASVTITLPDVTPPVITAFTASGTSTSLIIPILNFTASDAVGVSGYLVNESAIPPLPGDTAWNGTAPVSYTVATAGDKTLYAWAKDAAGNISIPMSASVTVTLPDVIPPIITAFSVPTNVTSLTVSITSFTASDAVGVSGYLVNESATPPLPGDTNWSGTAPASYSAAATGTRTLYAWARDAAGNISVPMAATVTFVLPDVTPPVIAQFTVPASSTSLIIPVGSFTASDTVGVTGYCITEVSSYAACNWTGIAPASYATTTAGTRILYSWAKDAAGNVSNPMTANVTVTLTDNSVPVVTNVTIPAASTSLIIPLSEITATDDIGVTGYLVTEATVAPEPSDAGWTSTPPVSYTVATWGTHTLRAYAKDAAGNISLPRSATVTIGTDGVIVPAPDKTEPTITDALKSLVFAMKVEIPTAAELLHGDTAPLVNGVPHPDGEINLGDTIVILRRVVGL